MSEIITKPYALTYTLPGLRVNHHHKDEVQQYTLTGARAVAELHERLFNTKMKVILWRPTLTPYMAFDEVGAIMV